MAKIVNFRTPTQAREARLVRGIAENSRAAQNELYAYCYDYYSDNYRAVFFTVEQSADEIFQDAFIALWENIEKGRLYERDGMVMTDKDHKPLNGSLLTYFMGIARNKYREWARDRITTADCDIELGKQIRDKGFDSDALIDEVYDPDENGVIEIIADVISHMSPRCYEILSKFYYEEKDLDTILLEIPSITTKNALKTKKHSCMETLRSSVLEIRATM